MMGIKGGDEGPNANTLASVTRALQILRRAAWPGDVIGRHPAGPIGRTPLVTPALPREP
jgi:hypothetical protein